MCIIKESHNPTTRYTDTVCQVNDLISPKEACHYLSHMYYNYTLNIHGWLRNFKRHLQNDTWSYYTLHIIMDVFDMQSLDNGSQLWYMMNDSVLSFVMPDVYRLFLNITIQHVHDRFNNVLSS